MFLYYLSRIIGAFMSIDCLMIYLIASVINYLITRTGQLIFHILPCMLIVLNSVMAVAFSSARCDLMCV